MPHRFWAQRKPPPSRRTMGVTSTTSEHLRPGGRPDSTIRLQAALLLPTHDSRLGLRPITAINASADLLLNLLNRGPVLRPIPGMNRVALVFRVVEVALRKRVWGGLRRLLPLPLEPVFLGLGPGVFPGHAVNLATDLLLILLGSRNSGVSEVAVSATLAEVVALALEEVLPVLNRVALSPLAKRGSVRDRLVGAGRTTGCSTTAGHATLSATDLLTELAHVKVRVRLPTTRNGNFLMSTHAGSGQAELFNERLAQFRVLVDLVSGPRVQAGRFSLNANGMGVSVTGR